MNADKVILTNLGALGTKYTRKGVSAILGAVRDLIAADRRRRLATVLVVLDDADCMGKFHGVAVRNPVDARQNKIAVDAVCRALGPQYVMLLGAADVVPHQTMKNPLYSPPEGDIDRFVFGDLPYACDSPFSHDIRDFCGPTRVAGRLPDVTGGRDASYLVDVLRTAARWRSRPPHDYRKYLGISAEAWRHSTAETLMNVFESDRDLHTSPREGYQWPAELLHRRMHFINCHGAPDYPNFLGQSSVNPNDMPIAHRADFVAIPSKILEGTIVSAECCYGAELYDASLADDGQMAMCNTYLARKAYAFFGSTTLSYGPRNGNGQADLICRYFLQSILAGASLGRAVLEARLRFIQEAHPLSLTDWKTLGQFNLYGDPSIAPVAVPIFVKTASSADARAKRREVLRETGALLSRIHPRLKRSRMPKSVYGPLRLAMARAGLQPVNTFSFRGKGTMGLHAIVGVSKGTGDSPTDAPANRVRQIAVIEMKEVNGTAVISETHSK